LPPPCSPVHAYFNFSPVLRIQIQAFLGPAPSCDTPPSFLSFSIPPPLAPRPVIRFPPLFLSAPLCLSRQKRDTTRPDAAEPQSATEKPRPLRYFDSNAKDICAAFERKMCVFSSLILFPSFFRAFFPPHSRVSSSFSLHFVVTLFLTSRFVPAPGLIFFFAPFPRRFRGS